MEKKTAIRSMSQVVEEDMIFNWQKAIEELENYLKQKYNFSSEFYEGLEFGLRQMSKDVECPRCKGTKFCEGYDHILEYHSDSISCPDCEGKGTIPKVMRFMESQ